MDPREKPPLDLEVFDLEGLRVAVGDWLAENAGELRDGGWGDVVSLVGKIAPHVREATKRL